jgi:hypothetical protein
MRKTKFRVSIFIHNEYYCSWAGRVWEGRELCRPRGFLPLLSVNHSRRTHTRFFPFLLYNRIPRNCTGQGRCTPFCFSVWIRAYTLLFCSLYGSGQKHSFSVLYESGRRTPFLFSSKIMADTFLLGFYNHGRLYSTFSVPFNRERRTTKALSLVIFLNTYQDHGSRTPVTLFLQIRTVTLLSVSLNRWWRAHSSSVFLISSQ